MAQRSRVWRSSESFEIEDLWDAPSQNMRTTLDTFVVSNTLSVCSSFLVCIS